MAQRVTVLQLLNHTAGWSGDVFDNTGDGDDALARYVEVMADVEQVTPLGAEVSYNNASLSIAGRIIEKVTGKTYEQAIQRAALRAARARPLLLLPQRDHDAAVRRRPQPARRRLDHRGPAVGAGPQRQPGRRHLVQRRRPDRLGPLPPRRRAGGGRHRGALREAARTRCRRRRSRRPGSALGDAIGISWMLRDVDGVRIVGHGGDTIGQHSTFDMVPERQFAITGLTNCGPNGNQLLDELGRWALEAYLGVVDRDPEPVALDAEQLAEYAGTYETVAAIGDVTLDGQRWVGPQGRDQARDAGQAGGGRRGATRRRTAVPPRHPARTGDRYIVTDGPAKGMKGYFVRDADGAVESVHVGGRLATKVAGSTDAPR